MDVPELHRQIEHVNSSMADAHEKYGDDFECAYKELTSMPPTHEGAREIVGSIWHSTNPGEELMRWHRRQLH
jgi:hypothetical protein